MPKEFTTAKEVHSRIHPDFTRLLERYNDDGRYSPAEKLVIITRLQHVGSVVKSLDFGENAVMITGSYSSYSEHKKVLGHPESDIDLVLIKPRGKTEYRDKDLTETFRTRAKELGFEDISNLIEAHTVILPKIRVRRMFLDKITKGMVSVGTMITGNIESNMYGIQRDNASYMFFRPHPEL